MRDRAGNAPRLRAAGVSTHLPCQPKSYISRAAILRLSGRDVEGRGLVTHNPRPGGTVDIYAVVKTIHILSATVLFGTGVGTAFFFWRAHAPGQEPGRLAVARTTVLADWLFTTPAVILQPATGAWLVWQSGLDWAEPWLVITYALYLVAGLCWVPVVGIQLRLKAMLETQALGARIDADRYRRLYRTWLMLGWPAFGALIAIFFLMVLKPAW